MKIFVFAVCILLVCLFLYDFQKVNRKDGGWKAFIRVAFDAFVIIAFAIIEKGRW